jgi:hypothetical protein
MTYRELKELDNGILISHHFNNNSPDEYGIRESKLLKPISRDHYFALNLAKNCERAALSGDDGLISITYLKVLKAHETLLEPHFQFEEMFLLPLLKSIEVRHLVDRSISEHHDLCDLLKGLRRNDAEPLGSFGKYLTVHVRFEERELFPLLAALLRH